MEIWRAFIMNKGELIFYTYIYKRDLR